MVEKSALFTSSDRISVSREGLDATIFDEGIASAISEEKSAADGLLAGSRKLTEEVNKAEKFVGVLALQGAFEKHAQMLKMLGVKARYVRRPCDLTECQALIIPGGESTTMRHHLRHAALLEPLKRFAGTFPVFGTCAGLILMANDLKLLDLDVSRNGFGPQIASFSAPLESDIFHQYQGVFIRAPRIMGYREGITVLAFYQGEAVLVQKGPYLAASFHPELTGDPAIHRYFLELVFKQI